MAAPAFLALITPIGNTGPVDPGYFPPGVGPGQPGGPGQPPGIWGPTDPRPTHPIAGWDPGSGTWPQPPQQPPLVIWGPGDPRPTNPISGMGPGGNFPGGGGGQPPLGFWGPNDPRPTPPIAEPPWGWGGTPPVIELPPEVPDIGPVKWTTAWTQPTGWIVIGIPTGNVPTPSAA